MVFTPFTRVDHDQSCITFVVGFIAKEDIVSFEWLFRSFLKAMGGNEPNCMITDQDPAMKIAVKSVLKCDLFGEVIMGVIGFNDV